MNKKTKTVIGYARTAIDVKNTVFNSIEKQEKLIKNYCKKNNIELSGVLFDPAQSGLNINRPALNMLYTLAANKKITSIVCSGPDRLSRDTASFSDIKNLFNNDGVELIFIY